MADVAPVEYPERRARWAREHGALVLTDRNIAFIRLAVFGVGVLGLVLALRGILSAWWLVGPVVAFIPLLKRHEQVIRARDAAAGLVTFYDRGLARLEDRWAGTGDTGERFLDDEHLYAVDLDLFGRVVVGWIWLRQALVARRALAAGAAGSEADFYQGKVHAARYFMDWELAGLDAQARLLGAGNRLTYDMQNDWF